MKRATEIVKFARELREIATDPFELARRVGVKVNFIPGLVNATFINIDGYKPIISINENLCENKAGSMFLCAHELGHFFLHSEQHYNTFATTLKNIHTSVEYEANIFAVAYICDDDMFQMPVVKMSNPILKSIIDYNLE